jgi:hypothetical protein
MSQQWFQCFPGDLLNEIAGMPHDAGSVYLVTYMRIFDADGPVADDASVIARRIDLPLKRARAGLAWLVCHGKIEKLGTGYDVPATRDLLADRRKKIQDKRNAGKESARAREQKLLTFQQNNSTAVQHPFNNVREDEESDYKRESTNESRATERALFDRFWQVWPHKVGKTAAEKQFRKVWREADAIIVGIQKYIASRRTDQPWLNPATFLNQRRWEDRPATAQAPIARKFRTADEIRTSG